jgi:hypothetical protein
MSLPFGIAAPAPGVVRHATGRQDLMEKLWELEGNRPRAHSLGMSARGWAEVTIFELDKPGGQPVERWRIELPAVVRGRFITTYEDWLQLEIDEPTKKSEVLA